MGFPPRSPDAPRRLGLRRLPAGRPGRRRTALVAALLLAAVCAVLPAGSGGWTAGLLALGLLFALPRPAPDADGLPQVLGLLAQLQDAVRGGQDFFAALASSSAGLPPGRVQRAVRATLAGFDVRTRPEDCLRPLCGGHPLLACLAADVRRAGCSPTPALEAVLRLLALRAARDWERGRRRRVLADRWEGVLHQLRIAAVGAAATAAFLLAPGPAVPAAPSPAAASTAIPDRAARLPHLPDPTPSPAPAPDDALAPPSPAAAAPSCRIATGYPDGWARLREAPGMAALVSGYAAEGTLFLVLGEGGDAQDGLWRRVRGPDGLHGWVYARLCVPPPG